MNVIDKRKPAEQAIESAEIRLTALLRQKIESAFFDHPVLIPDLPDDEFIELDDVLKRIDQGERIRLHAPNPFGGFHFSFAGLCFLEQVDELLSESLTRDENDLFEKNVMRLFTDHFRESMSIALDERTGDLAPISAKKKKS